MSDVAYWFHREPTGVCGCLLVSQGAYSCLLVSAWAYWYLRVPTGVWGCLLLSEGTCGFL